VRLDEVEPAVPRRAVAEDGLLCGALEIDGDGRRFARRLAFFVQHDEAQAVRPGAPGLPVDDLSAPFLLAAHLRRLDVYAGGGRLVQVNAEGAERADLVPDAVEQVDVRGVLRRAGGEQLAARPVQ
jgi:hypothetical protein